MVSKFKRSLMISTLGLASACAGADADQGDIGATDVSETTQLLSPGTWRLISMTTNYCLDSDATGHVYATNCNNGDNQKWIMTANAGGIYKLQNKATGRCLDANSADSVYTLPCNSGSYQRWFNQSTPSDPQTVNLATGKCLDGDWQNNVYTHTCNHGGFQRWTVYP